MIFGPLSCLVLSLTGPSSDMGGTCPNGDGPPTCYGGAKWSANDPLFFLHHAVCDHSIFLGSRLTDMGYVDGR